MSVDVSVVSTAHDVADARLHRVVSALVGAGLEVEVIGLGEAANGPAEADVRTMPRRGLLTRVRRSFTVPVQARGRVLFTLDPDLVPGATLRTRLSRRKLVVDVHEDFRAVLRDRAWVRGATGWLAARMVGLSEFLAGRADLTVVADDHIPPQRARNRLVVRNLPDRRHLTTNHPLDPTPRAVYVGDVRASRGLLTMLDAMEAAPEWRLDVIGPVAPGDADQVRRWQQSSPASSRVRFLGRMPPERAWAEAAGAWCGFALLEDTPAFREAVPSKLYEYLTGAIPVLATPLPRMVEILEASRGGEVAASTEEVVAHLKEWAADRAVVEQMSGRGAEWALAELSDAPYAELAAAVRALDPRR